MKNAFYENAANNEWENKTWDRANLIKSFPQRMEPEKQHRIKLKGEGKKKTSPRRRSQM